jgi:Zn-dependent protease
LAILRYSCLERLMEELNLVQRIAVWLVPVLLAITLHEVAHGWMANRLGDPTARMLGRLTLNPLRHIDPIGTVAVPLLLLTFGGFLFGWAKPVPVTSENLRSPRRDMALVAVAGPAANLLMILLWALIGRLGVIIDGDSGMFLLYSAAAGIFINSVLMVLNMLPIPPLDGGRVAVSLLPGPMAWQLGRLEPWGLFIMLGLIATGLLSKILWPMLAMVMGAIVPLIGISAGGLQMLLIGLF